MERIIFLLRLRFSPVFTNYKISKKENLFKKKKKSGIGDLKNVSNLQHSGEPRAKRLHHDLQACILHHSISEIVHSSLCLWCDPAVPSVLPALRLCRRQPAPSHWRYAGFFRCSGWHYSETQCLAEAELAGTADTSKWGRWKNIIATD